MSYAVTKITTDIAFDPDRSDHIEAACARHLDIKKHQIGPNGEDFLYRGVAVSLYYHSLPLLGYDLAFLIASHVIVVSYEEPTLERQFGNYYVLYCQRAGRWLPHLSPRRNQP